MYKQIKADRIALSGSKALYLYV